MKPARLRGLVRAGLQRVGPETRSLLEAPRHRQDIDEVLGRQGLVSSGTPTPSDDQQSPAMLLGAREIPGHAKVGQVGFRGHFLLGEPKPPGELERSLITETRLLVPSDKVKEKGP